MKLVLTALILLLFSVNTFAQQEDLVFFPFNNGVKDNKYDTPEKQVKLLLDNGYTGMEKENLDDFDAIYSELIRNNLAIYTIYLEVNLDNINQPYDPRFEEVLSKLKGSDTMFWLYLRSKKFPPSSVENDRIAVPILQEMADMAQRYGIKLMLYPHRWFWVESPDDGIRVAKKVNRRNFGMTFNLCHYLSLEDENKRDPWQRLPKLAQEAKPYLFAISLNGADISAGDSKNVWNHFIQPLGEGNFDTFKFLKTFVDLGFNGPVGLQCYNIKEDKAEHLKKSIETWRSYQARLN